MNRRMCIWVLFLCLFLFLFFFFIFLWESMGLLVATIYWVCHMFFFSFRLGLLSYLLFRFDVGLWVVGLLCYNIYIFFKILVQKFFWAFFFCLKVEQIIFLFEGVFDFAWGCSYFFFKGKQIKKFKLLYIIFFPSLGFPGNTLDSMWHCHCC